VPTPSHGPIGPFPAGVDPVEYDKRRRRVLWKMPSGLYLVGSRSGPERNLMTLNWATQVASDPKLVAVSIEKGALTHRLIATGRTFSVNLLERDDRALVRKFVKPADFDEEAASVAGIGFHDGATGVPIVDQALAWIECRLHQDLDCGSHTLFVGEVVDAGFPSAAEDGAVLRMEDTRMNYGG
jgi:flavin reductase (DIM6/NTAB) family NADH-FMN oxidoreductase RutF